MEVQRRTRHYRSIDIPIGEEMLSLPNEIIKSYLPNLWQRQGRRAMATGYLNLERFLQGKGENARMALSIILHALEASETGSGVGSELKTQLEGERKFCAMHAEDPERK
ncbi:MAG: hypothetical protein Q9184_003013, partial [Pyrenodesmia sp. 2 TL-2023]